MLDRYDARTTFESPEFPNDTLIAEYIGVQLLSPLETGTKYYVSFKANLALNNNHTFNQATNNLGILFSTVPYSNSNPLLANNFAHIYSTSVITDTINWTTISGSFIADSVYKYLIIGRFFDDSHTIIVQMQDTLNWGRQAYYYIDNVYVSTNPMEGIVEQDLKERIYVYPNPFTDSTIIELNNSNSFNDSQIIIYNAFGREVRKYLSVGKKIKIERENLLSGIYFLNIKIDNKTLTQKLIIQ